MTGKQKFKLANAALGAIVTHALANSDGSYIVASESGKITNISIHHFKHDIFRLRVCLKYQFQTRNYFKNS